jgi:L-lactate dehydrogenase complex protein LldG
MTSEVLELFIENAGKAAAHVVRLAKVEVLGQALAELLPSGAAVYCPGKTALEQAAVTVPGKRVPEYAAAEICVEEVEAGIAETGSLVCSSAGGRAVQASLLPDRHVALLPAAKIFATLDDYFAAVAAAPPANLTLITGPSRTADIELTLAIGVHGPARLDILVVGEAPAGIAGEGS